MFNSKCVLLYLIGIVTVFVSGIEHYSNGTSEIIGETNHRRSRAYSGDIYLDGAYDSCIKFSNALSCFKYKALKYLHKIATPNLEESKFAAGLQIFGTNVKLVAVPENMETSRQIIRSLLPNSEPRSSDSELDGLYKFVLREAERFVGSHALSVRIPSGVTSGRDVDSAQTPRLIDEENISNNVEDDLAAGKSDSNICLYLHKISN